MITVRKKQYYKREVDKLTADGSHQIPYKILKNIADTKRPKMWTVEDLAKDKQAKELGEDLADYFSSISQEFDPFSRSDI